MTQDSKIEIARKIVSALTVRLSTGGMGIVDLQALTDDIRAALEQVPQHQQSGERT